MANTTYTRICLFCNNPFITHDRYKKFCNLSCSSKNMVKTQRERKLQNYLLNPKRCLQCNDAMFYDKRANKFCSHSCSATYTNSQRDYTKIKTGPKKGTIPHTHYSKHPPHTKISKCTICRKYHSNVGKTCSPQCKSKLLSKSIKSAIFNGHNPKRNRGRHKRSWLETSFENWLLENKVTDFITEQPFKRHDQVKTYFADFYFPKLNLIIELDGTQHKHTQEYDQQRDQYISDRYHLEIIRVSHKEYCQKIKLPLIQGKLGVK